MDAAAVFTLKRDFENAPQYYRAAFTAFRRFVGAKEVGVESLTETYLDLFVTDLLKSGKSLNTAASYFRAIKAVYNKDIKAGTLVGGHRFPSSLKILSDRDLAASLAPVAREEKSVATCRYWYAVRNNSFPDREKIAEMASCADPEGSTFLPEVRYRRLNRDGRPVEVDDPLLRNLVFVKAFPSGIADLQREAGVAATVYFHMDGTDKRYSIISPAEMRNFIIAVRGGLDGVERETVDSRRFRREQHVRVVGDPLFDGLEGVVERDSCDEETHVLIRLTGFNMVCWTKKIHRSQLRLLD